AWLDILVRKQENQKCAVIRERIDELMKAALGDVEKYGLEFFKFIAIKKDLSERFDGDFYYRKNN
ncbi:MAG: hypothetical protein K2G37_01360, partial [Clostridia bacterium]|nr:hypothetical protein [Clostridia bacterium]